MTPEAWDALDGLEALARHHSRSVLDYALGWLASKSFVSCIIAGATTAEQVIENVAAAQVDLTSEEIKALDKFRINIPRFNERPYMEDEKGRKLRDHDSIGRIGIV